MSGRASVEEVRRCLAPTALAGAPLSEVPLPDQGERTWVVDLDDGELVPFWTQARDALAPLGLHPVAVGSWGERDWLKADLFSRSSYGDDAAPAAVIARSHGLSVDDALGRFPTLDDWTAEHWDDVVAGHLELTADGFGSAPEAADLADVPRGDELALQRRLLAWEEQRRPTSPGERVEFGWFDPRPHDRVGLALLPVAQPCHAPAYLSFHGAEGDGLHEALIRLLCSWQQDFGAQLVAVWGTMLQLVASRPASTLEAAFALADQHVRVAPATTLLPGSSTRELARHLWRGERWFLHERP